MYGIKTIKSIYRSSEERYDMSNLLDWVSYTIKTSDPKNIPNFGYHGDTPLGDTWGIVYSYAPNVATLLDDSNWESMLHELDQIDPDSENYTIERFNSWITPTENLMIRLITDDGIPTEEAKLAYELLTRLDNYPVLDEDDYSAKEYGAELECIRDYVRYSDLDVESLPENYIGLIWEALSDNGFYSEDGYYSEDDIESAIADLGWALDYSEDDSD